MAKLVPALFIAGVLLISSALAMYSLPLGVLALGAFMVAAVLFEVYG